MYVEGRVQVEQGTRHSAMHAPGSSSNTALAAPHSPPCPSLLACSAWRCSSHTRSSMAAAAALCASATPRAELRSASPAAEGGSR